MHIVDPGSAVSSILGLDPLSNQMGLNFNDFLVNEAFLCTFCIALYKMDQLDMLMAHVDRLFPFLGLDLAATAELRTLGSQHRL